mmetsp:Transcript_66682/g.214825  ORF Transcript_66682/g.214825 Transcript_66682/m.214825 type:complete len:207 (-) Transcript_66682:1407-2027(-)
MLGKAPKPPSVLRSSAWKAPLPPPSVLTAMLPMKGAATAAVSRSNASASANKPAMRSALGRGPSTPGSSELPTPSVPQGPGCSPRLRPLPSAPATAAPPSAAPSPAAGGSRPVRPPKSGAAGARGSPRLACLQAPAPDAGKGSQGCRGCNGRGACGPCGSCNGCIGHGGSDGRGDLCGSTEAVEGAASPRASVGSGPKGSQARQPP